MSNTTYHPDAWAPVLLESDQHGKVYKVLAGWYGGYLNGDSWKLSSGIESIKVEQHQGYRTLTMPQSSGSVYVVGERTHMSMLMSSAFAGLEEQVVQAIGPNGKFSIRVIDLEELLAAFEQGSKT